MASESMILANASNLFPPPSSSIISEGLPPLPTFQIVYACFPADEKSWWTLPRFSALLVRCYTDGSSEVLLRGTVAHWDGSKVNGWHYILHGLFEVTALEIEKKFCPQAVPAAATDDGYIDVSTERAEQDKYASQGPPPYNNEATAQHSSKCLSPCILLEPVRLFLPRRFESIEAMLEALAERKWNRKINGPHIVLEPSEFPGDISFFPGREELVEEFEARCVRAEK